MIGFTFAVLTPHTENSEGGAGYMQETRKFDLEKDEGICKLFCPSCNQRTVVVRFEWHTLEDPLPRPRYRCLACLGLFEEPVIDTRLKQVNWIPNKLSNLL